MSSDLTHRTTCRLCDSVDVELVLPLAPTPIADAYVTADQLDTPQKLFPLDVYFCRACGHIQLLDVVNPRVLFGDYIYHTSDSPGLVEHFRRYADELVSRFTPPEGGLAVDIGSNDGTLLRFLNARGLRVVGVDPAADVARQASASGIETIVSFFDPDVSHQIREQHGPASLITANNVFAHADDLAQVATGIRDLLAPDGVFVFEVSYLVDLMDNMVFDWIYHEHLSYHSILPLRAFLERVGLQLLDAERVSTKGGSIRAVAQRGDGPRQPMASIDVMVAGEKERQLDRPEAYLRFAAEVDAAGARVRNLLEERSQAGQLLAGYGASATTTTLLYHFGVGHLLQFLVDDNPLRDDRFSPGLHLPVLASPALVERRPDGVLLCAWRYADMILQRQRAYVDGGGQFIIPLPELAVQP
jgi:SAM-dependent methyltransferase